MGFFSKKPPAPPANGTPEPGAAGGGDNKGGAPHRDIAKAQRFFEHGQTMSDARNFDYAIDMYIQGLKHSPDSIVRHEQLHDVAKRRRVSGGKPMSQLDIFKERMSVSKDPVDKMLFCEKVWAKDPFNLDHMIKLMELANEADDAEPDLMIREVTLWLGSLLLDAKLTNKALKQKDYVRVMNLLREVDGFTQAIEACKAALMLDQSNQELIQTLKDLETQLTIRKGNYERTEKTTFRDSVKDTKTQEKLQQDDALTQTEDQLDVVIKRRREEWEAKPEDTDLGGKLVEALRKRDTEATDQEAVTVLDKLYESSKQFRFKATAGDVKMKQLRKKVEDLRKAAEANKENAQAIADYKQANQDRYKFELEEFAARVREYPTECEPRYQYARRLMFFKKFDEAIAELQVAKKDAKVRAASYQLLGECFRIQGYLEEAVETLRQGLVEQSVKTDKSGLELQYLLMDSLERLAAKSKKIDNAREAMQLASNILQADINFKDIRTRVDNLRKTLAKMSEGSDAGSGVEKPA